MPLIRPLLWNNNPKYAITKKIFLMPKTTLFSSFRKAFRVARVAHKNKREQAPELFEHIQYDRAISRRKAIQSLGIIGGTMMLQACGKDDPIVPTESGPKIAIIGGGLAGLSAAYYLKQNGFSSTVYEAADRFGGRTFSIENALPNGAFYEAGGEFINSGDAHLLELIDALGLEVVDLMGPSETDLVQGFYFDGAEVSIGQLAAALEPFIPLFEADYEALDEDFDTVAPVLDAMSCTEYFDAKGVNGFLRSLLDIVITGEFGLDPDHVSALLFIYQLPFVEDDSVKLLGEDLDERFKIKTGTSSLIAALENALDGQLVTGAALTAVSQDQSGKYTLSFDGQSDVSADVVLLGVPVSILRQIEINVQLPSSLVDYIDNVGLGTNSKVIVEYQNKPWRALGFNGDGYSDEGFQTCWDATQSIDGGSAITYFLGGNAGLNIDGAHLSQLANQYTQGLNKLFPGLASVQTSNHWSHNWAMMPLAKCSYACLKPLQYTNAIDHFYIESDDPEEQQYVFEGNLGFIGEAFSDEYQGFMNGAVQTAYLAVSYIEAELIV